MARKILLADDSVTAQNMGRKILADAGYEVITVNNGSAALKRISETKPDLIVLDVYMPGYSGLEVCQRLKETGETSRIPIVLTVGKLEPFKPEEAKRVRADGFIVKPFEASELLSALSKLEDRIVPRPEPTKPGRFARANAAIDAAYDKSVANTNDDAGWKNRIQFPTRKKASEPESADDAAIYNPLNKDLRTTIDAKKASNLREVRQESAQPTKEQVQEEARVDLGALAPEGLPKDVTPEEIAALAAAAAQVKGKLSESEAASAAEPPAPPKPATSGEERTEPKAEPHAAPEPPKEVVAGPSEPVAQAEKKIAEVPVVAPTIPASAELAPVAAISAANSGIGAGSREDESVTMAVAAGAEYSAIPTSRWKAVPVAVLAEEAALSLEEEMRKALSAVAAAEMAQPAPVTTLASAADAARVAVSEIASPAAAVDEAVTPAPMEPAATMSAIATDADAISEAVKDLEAVAASFTDLHKPAAESAAETLAAVVALAAPAETGKIEMPAAAAEAVTAKSESAQSEPAAALGEKRTEVEEKKLVEVKIAEVKPAEAKFDAEKIENSQAEVRREEVKLDDVKLPDEANPVAAASVEAVSAETVAEIAARVAESSQAAVVAAVTSAQEASDEPPKPAASHKSVFGGGVEMAKESEMAEHTAAAWASWRRIRDTGDGKNGSSKDGSSKDGSSKDTPSKENLESKAKNEQDALDEAKAAMAVAAGAEKAPEEAAASEDSEVSAIVDSVLAEMRPRIVEEISRKLGKKK